MRTHYTTDLVSNLCPSYEEMRRSNCLSVFISNMGGGGQKVGNEVTNWKACFLNDQLIRTLGFVGQEVTWKMLYNYLSKYLKIQSIFLAHIPLYNRKASGFMEQSLVTS